MSSRIDMCKRSVIVYLVQMSCVLAIALACIISLCLNVGERDALLIVLSTVLGYILPCPKISKKKLLWRNV